jgi:threonine/homoserine/homoserine lactone efflux protein
LPAPHRRVGAAAVAALGIGAGLLFHTFAAAIGLSVILAASATAFTIVKWAGAVYLIYVGLSLLTARPKIQQKTSGLHKTELRTVFLQGFLTNVLNPKVALFFLAFLPQFVDPAAASKSAAFLFLGVVFTFNGTLWNLLLAWSAARLASSLNGSASVALWLNRTVGALFVYLGIRLITSHES